jgi:hypothetical protein
MCLHELGHLVAGWLVEFRFTLVSLGPFFLTMEHGRLRFGFRREMLALGSAGMCIETLRKVHRRLLWFSAGGIIANAFSIPLVVILVNHAFGDLGKTWIGALAAQFTLFSSITISLALRLPERSRTAHKKQEPPALADG